ncbi:UbiH/UbiF family hydroxylase [Oharaeibacter diazotrophicus]|uniref:2-octaprenyl-6-methoxyphenol hydroxylase n=3 Tax=Oharaeibacter diazotrophicus TaxID=1920512 RepID=A0A4R6RL71_9HYPH|nr:UbiH/UbiF family hydroxylase [Oharaeibacter diazotrophicus]TDP86855.1 2-octaprenyl-6-methoxyphenol hydroxylase [Oharaeibacter diazotrophicus]BBE71202.1 2-octaprenyl-3-methyl-6-methoxy-1,4-benzoquinol hydroxylase [Pleomorphomonas sp. SM30]GLS77957.1 2-octaprenyl-6-methoxyphenyl hydroxylase [Oharaeibacter diazotrophicus]
MGTIDVEIAVVGGGPAGLTAALALSAAGAEVALVAPPAPPADHRTTALFAGSVEVLRAVGGWDRVADRAAPLKTMRLVDGTRRLVRAPEIAFHASELGLDAFGWNVANAALTEGLAAAVAADGRIRRVEATMDRLDLAGPRPELVTADDRTVTARLVVGADGRGSKVREAAGIAVKTWSYPQTALVLNLDHTAPHFDTSTEFHTETGPFTLVPLAARRSALVCIEKPAVAEALNALSDDALAADLERRAHSMLGRFTVASPRQLWPMAGLSAEALARGPVVLVAETCHAFPPIGAQGLNLGIRDIAALAEIVRRARTGGGLPAETIGERYAAARRSDVWTRTTGVDLLNRSLLTDFLPVQVGRAVLLQLARDVGPLRKLMMREGLSPRLLRST